MTRFTAPLIGVLCLSPLAAAQEVTYESLRGNPARSKVMDEGTKLIRKYYEYQEKVSGGDLKMIRQQDEASAEEAEDYVPNLPAFGLRLARRCWPGPVTLVFDDNHPDSALRQLPQSVQMAVCPGGTVGL